MRIGPYHDLAQPIDVPWKDLVHQRSSFRRQLAKDHPLVFGAGPPTHQPALFQLLDDVRGARTREENPIADLPERQRTLVIERLEDGELGHAQIVLREVGPHPSFDRLVRTAEGDDELQCGRPIMIVRCPRH